MAKRSLLSERPSHIDRTLCLQNRIKEDIFSDKSSKDFPDLIASTKQEFKQLC